MTLKIALVGYGSMGKEVEKAAKQKGIEISEIFDLDNPLIPRNKFSFDVAIDFSLPDAVLNNVKILAENKINCVIGTTGWYEKMPEISAIVLESGIGCVYGSNFSIGMNYFFKLVEFAAKELNKFEDYDIFLHEFHHKRKKDSPSGTALSLGNIILNNFSKKTKIDSNKIDGIIDETTLHISSTRGGEVVGIHNIFIDSISDTIELSHIAKNRSGFALGALEAAKWIDGKKGFYDFRDIFMS